MSFADDTSDCSDSSQSCDFSFGMDEFEEFESDSYNEGVEVVLQKDIDDTSNHSHDIVEEMSHLTLHCDGMCGNEEYQSKFMLMPLYFSLIKPSML